MSTDDRGFTRFEPVFGSWGGQPTGESVRVQESSAASGPHLWLDVIGDSNQQVYVHLTLEAATVLRDQLSYLIEHHYQLAQDA